MGDLILLRHGETEWSQAGKHTGRTDIPLTAHGAAAAAALAPLLARCDIVAAFSSPAQRAARTAELAGLRTSSRILTCGNGITAAMRAGLHRRSRRSGLAGICGGTA